jgi:hypothetical protein
VIANIVAPWGILIVGAFASFVPRTRSVLVLGIGFTMAVVAIGMMIFLERLLRRLPQRRPELSISIGLSDVLFMLITMADIMFIGYLSSLIPPTRSRYLVLAFLPVGLAYLRAVYRSGVREENRNGQYNRQGT